MNDSKIKSLKDEIIEIGKLMWDKDIATGLNGNISVKLDDKIILITGTKTCLGRLKKDDIIAVYMDKTEDSAGKASTEKLLHDDVYKNFPDINAVVHTHTAFINGYFLENDKLVPRIFESRVWLGDVEAVDQTTPTVTDTSPVISVLKKNNIMVLKNHGVVAMGKNLFDCFLLIQALEEAIKIDAVSKIYSSKQSKEQSITCSAENSEKKYKLFSKEQINRIVELVNSDEQLGDLGKKTNMTMDLAVKLNETGDTFSFNFKDGRINNVGNNEDVEFLISAPEDIWRAVFNREIDPFVATTQKKMNLRGDFARISKFYAPCSRLFELWAQVPVE